MQTYYDEICLRYKHAGDIKPVSDALVLNGYTRSFSHRIWAGKTKLPSWRLFIIIRQFITTLYPISR